MSELEQIKVDIKDIKAKLKKAEDAGAQFNDPGIISLQNTLTSLQNTLTSLQNTLTEQLKKENILLAQSTGKDPLILRLLVYFICSTVLMIDIYS